MLYAINKEMIIWVYRNYIYLRMNDVQNVIKILNVKSATNSFNLERSFIVRMENIIVKHVKIKNNAIK